MPVNVYNANWLASNLVRKYPLDSRASCIDVNGNVLPDDIITDIQIAYPLDLGEYCYVAAVNITKSLISILVAVDDTPIAALCASKSQLITRGGLYFYMDPLYDGVEGIITSGINGEYPEGTWSFVNNGASRILPSCCSPYIRSKVLSLSRPSDSKPLTGNILLTSGGDIKLSTDTVVIDGKPVKAIFIGLDLSVNPQAVLSSYVTGCDISTEMNTCALPYIESIGGAIPDCSGNINIVSGPTNTVNITTTDGIVFISTGIPLKDVCSSDSSNTDEDSDSNSNKCPYPSKRSDDICAAGIASSGIDYGFTGTDVDLYGNALQLASYSRSGLVYGSDPNNINAVTASDSTYPATVEVDIPAQQRISIAVSFPKSLDNGNPEGSIHAWVGNDQILIDRGQISVRCDNLAGDDSKYWGNTMLTTMSESIITFTNDQILLVTNSGTQVLADIDDGLIGTGDNKLRLQFDNDVMLEGIRYV